jgi:divalent metal cation (Fe/Co/Zn/Cd) transporter
MAMAALLGTLANLWFGLWWVEYAAALGLLYFLIREAREAVEAAWGDNPS